MAETITTHTRVHTPHLLFLQGGISLGTGLRLPSSLGPKMQAIINFGHLPQGTHTGGENGATSRRWLGGPIAMAIVDPWSHSSGADSARMSSTQLVYPPSLSAHASKLARGGQSGDELRLRRRFESDSGLSYTVQDLCGARPNKARRC